MISFIFGVFVAQLLITNPCTSLSVALIHPLGTDGNDTALIIAPGAYIKGAAYIPLATEVQKQSALKLWIVILDDFIDDIVNEPQLEEGLNEALVKLQGADFPLGGPIFLAGHSLGGMMVSRFAKSHADVLSGALLFSAYLTRGHRLIDYPIPLLTLSGDLDGLTRITRILLTFEELVEDVSKNETLKYTSPVIVMEGINHGLFASGNMPPEVLKYDFFPDVNITYGHQIIAKYVSAFITANVEDGDGRSREILDEGYSTTFTLMKPLQDMRIMDTSGNLVSHWTNVAETLIIQIEDSTKLNLENEEFDEIAFLKFHPLAGLAEGVCVVTSYTNVVIEPNPFDVTLKPLSPIELQAKMLDQESVIGLLPNETYGTETVTCKEINERSFETALLKVPSNTLSRYKLRGFPMFFYDDIVVDTENDWILNQLKLQQYNEGMNVTSFAYRAKGKFYCKLLAPYRAMEWIYLDSYQK